MILNGGILKKITSKSDFKNKLCFPHPPPLSSSILYFQLYSLALQFDKYQFTLGIIILCTLNHLYSASFFNQRIILCFPPSVECSNFTKSNSFIDPFIFLSFKSYFSSKIWQFYFMKDYNLHFKKRHKYFCKIKVKASYPCVH